MAERGRWLTRAGRGLVLATALVSCALAGPALAPSPAAAGQKSTDWRMAFSDAIDFQANIFASFDSTPYFIFTEVYDTLLNYNLKDGGPDLENSPTTAYNVSKDGLVYTFHLRPGMRWSDGKPFTADDVVFSYEHAADSNVNSTYTENLKSVVALDPTTVRMTLSRYDARFLTGYVPIVPEHIWAPHADTSAHLTKFDPCCPMVGSGAFTVTSLDPNGTIVLKPNPYFYGHPGKIKRILLIKYQDDDAALRDLELGQVDAINTGKTTWAVQLRKQQHAEMWSSPAPGFDEIAMNMCPPQGSPSCTGPGKNVHVKVVQDQAIRQALSWAIDRQALARIVYNGLYSPGTGIISTYYRSRGYYTSYAGDPEIGYAYDPAKAHQVLVQGGWDCPPIDSGGICTKDGTKAEFTLDLRSSDSQQQNVGLRVKAWAADIGIKIDLDTITEDALNAKIYNPTSSKAPADADKYEPTYDAFIWGWFGDLATPDYDFEVLACGNPSSDSFWCDQRYTDLTKQALSEPDQKKRVNLLHQAERIELAASPYIIYDFGPYLSVTRTDTWTNYQPSPQPVGQPFGTSWLQLQLIEPGQKASTSYAGTPWVIAFMVGTTAVVLLVGYLRRRREERQPLELPEPAATGARGR
ncbi:MAG TPA: ABC transporter substrate-binding protein [Gaiellales bacterium]|jgi:peptide/nickel transport system substrate-binding protein